MKRFFQSPQGMTFGAALMISLLLAIESLREERGDLARAGSFGEVLSVGQLVLFTVLAIGVLAIWREEQKRRHTEMELRNSESRNRAVLEAAVDAIVTIDEHGSIEAFNPAAEQLFGFPRSEVIGRNVSLLMESSVSEAHDGFLAAYRESGVKQIIGRGREVMCRRRDGTTFPAELAVGEYHIEKERKFTGFFRDISARKLAETQIRDQAALLDHTQEAIFIRDFENRITYWNRGAARLYGWSMQEVSEKSCGQLFFDGRAEQVEVAERAVRSGGDWGGELRRRTKDERSLIVESRWSLLRNDAGQPTGILVIETDVTEKKDRERQALRAQRLESIGTLAGGIAHDLNNMLTPILMSAKLLKKDRPITEREGLVTNILAGAERGAEMVKQLLSFAGGLDTQRARVDLSDVVREIRSLLEHTLPKSITIQTEVAEGLWPVSGDATQLSQVLMNLGVNARDAMPAGGRLTIHAANVSPDNSVLRSERAARSIPYVALEVTDTGSGIPPDVIDRVFDPFFTTKEQGKGTGLGLSTVLGIVRSHGGFVRVASELGRGSRFSIFLPRHDPPPTETTLQEAQVPTVGHGQLILVVDDEDFILHAVRAILVEAGYCVVTASAGTEAIAQARERTTELRAALVDMMMPGMDGPTTMQALQQIAPQLRIIATSGLRMPEEAPSVTACVRAFLQKPYTVDQLLVTLARVLHE